ncbi:hypothetical protein SAMN05720759_105192 [Fibrobacter sp. UWB12]|nr:hypothetical protein SAMN05720759_105192 [Fibrobacter sp. UWB12]
MLHRVKNEQKLVALEEPQRPKGDSKLLIWIKYALRLFHLTAVLKYYVEIVYYINFEVIRFIYENLILGSTSV